MRGLTTVQRYWDWSQINRRSLDGAELAKRNPGFSGHDHRFGHSNLPESHSGSPVIRIDRNGRSGCIPQPSHTVDGQAGLGGDQRIVFGHIQ